MEATFRKIKFVGTIFENQAIKQPYLYYLKKLKEGVALLFAKLECLAKALPLQPRLKFFEIGPSPEGEEDGRI
jgi:hypothetical protein